MTTSSHTKGRSWRTAVLALALPALLSGCRQLANPVADVELQQSLYDLEDLLAQMRDESARQQYQLDSLQFIVARQDTVLRRLANLMGAPLP